MYLQRDELVSKYRELGFNLLAQPDLPFEGKTQGLDLVNQQVKKW